MAGPAILQLEYGHCELLMKYKRVAKPLQLSSCKCMQWLFKIGFILLFEGKKEHSLTLLCFQLNNICEGKTMKMSVTQTSEICEIIHKFPKECVLGD